MTKFFAYVAVIVAVIFLFLWLRNRNELNKIRKTAYFDAVTGGLAESGFYLRYQTFFSERSIEFALVSMQIANFAEILDILGVWKGNQILKCIYDVLKKQLGGDELIAKTGEDTFCFMLKNRKHDEVCAILNGICDATRQLSQDKFDTCPIELVYGIYFPTRNNEDIRIMMHKAFLVRKDASKNSRYRIHDEEEFERTNWEREVVASIPKAIEMGEFQVHLQPKIRVFDQRIVGAEALIRWRHPQRGLMYPDMFVPFAERYKKIEVLDRFVLEEVCRIISRLEKKGKESCPVSINLSRFDIHNPNLPEECYEICRKYSVSTSKIEFEIKESLAVENFEATNVLVERLHDLGFSCALDNFGVDVCSMQLLGKLDID